MRDDRFGPLKVINAIGTFLIFLHNEPSYYWGNLSVYVISYAVAKAGATADDIHPAWGITFFEPCWTGAMFASGYICKYVNVRWIIVLAILVLNCSFFVGYFLMDVSLVAFFVVFGMFVGLGSGLYEGPLLQHYVVNQSEARASFLTGLALAGGPTGGLIISQFVLWYTNPDNVSPDSQISRISIFTDERVLRKVPSMLLIVGGVVTALQLIGFLLTQNKSNPPTDRNKNLLGESESNTSGQVGLQQNYSSTTENGYQLECDNRTQAVDANCENDYTVKEMVRMSLFYKLFITNILGFCPRLVVFTYFKLYGQEWIHDDHFLTNLGTMQALVVIPATIVWGYILDKMSVRSTLVIMFSGISLSCLLMYFTAPWNKVAYFVVTLVASAFTNTYVCVNIATMKWFGQKNLAMNVALMEVASTFGTILFSLSLDWLIVKFGHFSEFACGSICSVLGLLIVAISLPSNDKIERR